ncbi:hypothetical protein F442_03492 [Phytophthora nicotianae P10297]|uniref:Uncharacterized protein n=1 Tax=Phytophthora nicotianae P10297 TaxID=1317064 RepID=W2ZVM6_PHYNI|nr:hypothetical protein F442_03492 [Phytophthora nicotianae P10297]
MNPGRHVKPPLSLLSAKHESISRNQTANLEVFTITLNVGEAAINASSADNSETLLQATFYHPFLQRRQRCRKVWVVPSDDMRRSNL